MSGEILLFQVFTTTVRTVRAEREVETQASVEEEVTKREALERYSGFDL